MRLPGTNSMRNLKNASEMGVCGIQRNRIRRQYGIYREQLGKEGIPFCGAVQGNDCTLAVVFMERPRLEVSTPDEPDEEIF